MQKCTLQILMKASDSLDSPSRGDILLEKVVAPELRIKRSCGLFFTTLVFCREGALGVMVVAPLWGNGNTTALPLMEKGFIAGKVRSAVDWQAAVFAGNCNVCLLVCLYVCMIGR